VSESVLGLDLSLTSTGIVAVPVDWADLDWAVVTAKAAGYALENKDDEWARSRRIDDITVKVLEVAVRHHCKVAAIEEYSFSRSSGHAFERGELGGVVKRELFRLGLRVHVYTANSSRKLLGTAPASDAKIWAHQRLYSLGAPKSWNGDQLDGFLAANHHLSLTGGKAVMLPPAPAQPKKPRARKAAAA